MVEFPSMNTLLLNLTEQSELWFGEGADNADCSTRQLPDLWCKGCVWLAVTAISLGISVCIREENFTLNNYSTCKYLYEMIADSQQGYRVGFNDLISNKWESNNSFIKTLPSLLKKAYIKINIKTPLKSMHKLTKFVNLTISDAVVSPAEGSKSSDSASVRVLTGLFPSF